MVIYSAGYAAVFILFALLYRYAYRQREALKLNEYEALCTRNAAIHHLGFAGIGVLVGVAAFLLPAKYAGFSGFLLSLNGVWGFWAGATLGAQERLTLKRMQADSGSQS